MKLLSKILILLTTLLLFSSPTLVRAEDQPVTTGDYFDVELSLGTQSAWTKKIPIFIKFRSNINADKVEISWDVPSNLNVKTSHPKFVKAEKGQVYTYKAYLKPVKSGTFNIAGNVTAWEVETNYTSSGYTSLTVGNDLVTVPQTAGYSGSVIIRYVVISLLFVGLIVGIYFGFKFGLSRLKEWLTPPE